MTDQQGASGKGVMVVDDELFFRSVLRDMLTRAGLPIVAEAADGDEAVAKYRQYRPALVLMDIYMINVSGIEATRQIVSMDPSARVLICSGSGFEEDIAAARQVGASGVIYKPFYEEEVITTIRQLLAG